MEVGKVEAKDEVEMVGELVCDNYDTYDDVDIGIEIGKKGGCGLPVEPEQKNQAPGTTIF